MLSIDFADASFVEPAVRDEFDLLLGVEATLSLRVSDTLIYNEPMFPIVELRVALDRWLRRPDIADFELDSMEADEPGFVWIRHQPSGGWRVGSIHQDEIAREELTRDEIVSGCKAFIEAVDRWVRDHLHLEVADAIEI